MKRVSELKQAAEDFLQELRGERIEKACRSFEGQQRIWEQMFRRQFQTLLGMKKEDTHDLVISWLSSSIITGGHTYQLAWYDEEFYVELSPPCIYYAPEYMFEGIGDDLDRIRDFLGRNFIRLRDYEIEEMRRHYLRMLYPEAKEFFRQLLPWTETGMCDVWFGEYMKNAKLMGRIGAE